jgi:hypothetical protein
MMFVFGMFILQILNFVAGSNGLIDSVSRMTPGARIAVVTYNDYVVYSYNMMDGSITSFYQLKQYVLQEQYTGSGGNNVAV